MIHDQRMAQHKHNMNKGRVKFMYVLVQSLCGSGTLTPDALDILVRIEQDLKSLAPKLNQRVNADGTTTTVNWTKP